MNIRSDCVNSLKPDIDEQTGEYKTCPVCGKHLIWTLDYKHCACSDMNCEYNCVGDINLWSKIILGRLSIKIKE